MLVRLFIENKNYSDVCKIVSNYFDGFTVIKAEGYWQGNAEHSLIIEIADIGKPDFESNIGKIVFEIKRINKQDKILIQEIACESYLK